LKQLQESLLLVMIHLSSSLHALTALSKFLRQYLNALIAKTIYHFASLQESIWFWLIGLAALHAKCVPITQL
jgi:hypothetical protein